MGSDDRSTARDVWSGFGLVFLLHVIVHFIVRWLGLLWMVGAPYVMFTGLIGFSQWVYVGPAILFFRWKRRPGIVKGLVVGAALTFLLNAACFGMFIISFGRGR